MAELETDGRTLEAVAPNRSSARWDLLNNQFRHADLHLMRCGSFEDSTDESLEKWDWLKWRLTLEEYRQFIEFREYGESQQE